MIESILKYTFLQHAVLGAVLASIACGIIGTIIVEKRLLMMSGGIAHTAFGGIGLGYYLGIEPILGALGFTAASALGITAIKRNSNVNSDVLVGMFWPLGMAMGILFIAFTPGYPPDMTSYLFGDILTVSRLDLVYMCILDAFILLTVLAFYNLMQAYLFDEEFSTALGLNTVFVEYLVFLLIAVTVVVMIRVVGIILILALLCVPPTISRWLSFNLARIMAWSILIGIVLSLAGLWVSYVLNVSSGASIVILAVFSYSLIFLLRLLVQKIKQHRTQTVYLDSEKQYFKNGKENV